MKKENIFPVLSVCGLVCVSVLAVGMFFFFITHPEPTVLQCCTSPDGGYTAYLYESNGGATTGWIYHISVLTADRKLGRGNGNVFTGRVCPSGIEWLDADTLYVNDFRSAGTTVQKQKYKSVTVQYASLARAENGK